MIQIFCLHLAKMNIYDPFKAIGFITRALTADVFILV